MPIPDRYIIELLRYRTGQLTLVHTKDVIYKVYNIAEGIDIGDEYHHLTTNISPNIPGCDFDFFYTDAITKITDEEDKCIFYEKR